MITAGLFYLVDRRGNVVADYLTAVEARLLLGRPEFRGATPKWYGNVRATVDLGRKPVPVARAA